MYEKAMPRGGKAMVDMSESSVNERIKMAKTALLSMQRYNWEQGVAAQAFLESGDGEETIALARSAIMRQENGRFSAIGQYAPITDSASVGQAVEFAFGKTGDPIFRTGVDEMLDVIQKTTHRSNDGTIYHTQEPTKYIMSDAFYMLPPFLASVGMYDEALLQIEGFRNALWHKNEKLYSHIWDDESGTFKREAFWGVGNGWTGAGISRVIGSLPDQYQDEKETLAVYVRDLVDGCIKHLRDDGMFHNVIDDISTFPEVNCSQMIAYTIYRGRCAGWLDQSYLTFADRMRLAAHNNVDCYGFVQQVCGVPDFNRSHVAPEGQAFFILMEAAKSDLDACLKP